MKTDISTTEVSSLNLEEAEWSNNVQQVGDPTHTAREFLMQGKKKKNKKIKNKSLFFEQV